MCRPVFRRRNSPVPRRRGGDLPPEEIGAGNAGAWYAPLQGHASHSDLCSSHHAGNAGSFGERVGVMGIFKVVPFHFAISGEKIVKASEEPRYNSYIKDARSLAQTFP